MAAVTLLRTLASTTDGTSFTTAAFTPTAGDLMAVVVAARGTVINPGVASTSDGMTFTLVRRVLWGTNAQIVSVYVADAVSVANSQTLNWSCVGDNSSNVCLAVVELSGMSKVGLTAVLQSEGEPNGASGATPTVVFGAAANTNNPIIFAAAVSANPAGLTAPATFTGIVDIGAASPTSGLHVSHDDSGFTSDTVTAGSTASSIYGAVAVEFDASAAGSTYTLDADAAAYTYSATAAGLEFDRLIDAAASSYTYTASAAGLEFDRQVVAEAASYVWAVQDAGLEFSRQLVADSAAYDWTANDTALEYSAVVATPDQPQLTYGAGRTPKKDYEARVRAYYERQEDLERQRQTAERDQRERDARLAELQKQQAKLDERKKQDSRKSAIAKRRAKLAREIEELRAAQQEAQEQIDALVAQIQNEITEQTMLLDRRRRMVLLLAAAA